MPMPTIVIMNQGTEHARGYDPTRSEPLRKSVGRCTWLVRGGDVVISPFPMERAFLEYVGETLGFAADSVTVLVDEGLRADALSLSTADIARLEAAVNERGAWTIMPCFWTPDVAELGARLGIGNPGALGFASQRGTELFNRKRQFRQLAAGASVPIPAGSIATSVAALQRALEAHLPVTGTVIVKKDNSAGGIGNVAVTTGPVLAVPGARTTRAFVAPEILAASLWTELTDAQDQVVVVEVYHAAPHSFYFEYFIGEDGRPRFLHSGDVRLRSSHDAAVTELVWVGLDTPTELPHFSLASALTLSGRFAALAGQLGCRGHINIDAIVTEDGELLFNESNARWGGGSPVHAIGEQLFGPRFADDHALSFVRAIKSPPRQDAVKVLKERGLHFIPTRGEGAIVLACSERESGTMECLLIGASRQRVRELEAAVRETLS